MTRYVIALLTQTFPRPIPNTWKTLWRAHIAQALAWLLAGLLFVLPWIGVTRWSDSSELPKTLFALGVMGLWLVTRAAYSLLADQEQVTKWSGLTVWIKLLGLAALAAWLASPHRALSWLGTSTQIATSVSVVALGLWFVVAVRDVVRRTPSASRLFLRAWLCGMLVALGANLFVLPHASFQALLSIPLVALAGLCFLGTRPTVSSPLNPTQLTLYRFGHAVFALSLVGVLAIGLFVSLGSLWWIVLAGVFVMVPLLFVRGRHLSLAGFVALVALVISVMGLWQSLSGHSPAWVAAGRQAFHVDQLTEILPNQALSWQIVSASLEKAPLLGAGPGGWLYVFDRERPLALNQTSFWDIRFPQGASALTMGLAEYGLLPTLLFAAFCGMLIWSALKRALRTRNPNVLWEVTLVLATLVFATLHPLNVVESLTLALFLGFLAHEVFQENRISASFATTLTAKRVWAVLAGLFALAVLVFILQRSAAAEILTEGTPTAWRVSTRLNPADDASPDREAQSLLALAQRAQSGQHMEDANQLLAQANARIGLALARNPNDAAHWSVALSIAQLAAAIDPTKDEQVIQTAEKLRDRYPTNPLVPLAEYAVYRARMGREARWIEQSEGREKEAAVTRQSQAQAAADQALETALRLKPDYPPALYAKAAWLAQFGKSPEAIAVLQALATQQPASPDILLPLALLYRESNQADQAVGTLALLVQRFPQVAEYQWQLAEALIQAKRYTDATELLQRLIANNPQEVNYQTELKNVLRLRAQAQGIAPTPIVAPVPEVATSTTVTPPAPTRRTTRARAPSTSIK